MNKTLTSVRALLILAAAAFAAAMAVSVPAAAGDLALDGNLRGDCGTATASAGAATLNNKCGVITSEILTTAAGSSYTLTLTNTVAAATDLVVWSVENGTNTQGDLQVGRALPGAGSITFTAKNADFANQTNGQSLAHSGAPSAFGSGTIKIRYFIIKQ